MYSPTTEEIAALFDRLAELDPNEWFPPKAVAEMIREPQRLVKMIEEAESRVTGTADRPT